MKKIFLALMLFVASVAAHAEASFQQIQGLIEQKQYSSAAAGLEEIIRNHPQSAKAFYAMAQAQAGLGDLAKAKRALDKARGLDPELKFASSANVASLEQAITPQMAKIERVEDTNYWVPVFIFLLFAAGGGVLYVMWVSRAKKHNAEVVAGTTSASASSSEPAAYTGGYSSKPVFGQIPPKVPPTQRSYSSSYTPPYVPPSTPAVHNHYNSGGSDMLTGVLIGSMLSDSNHHTHTERIVEREVVRETPVRDSSWDTPEPYVAPAQDSSWDTTPSTAGSSSREDEPEKKSSSSWHSGDSGSSSSDWGSSSSSDGGSSSSSSSSSWD